jgi:hypothetical protein
MARPRGPIARSAAQCHYSTALNVVTRIREGSIEPGTRAIVAARVAAAVALLWLSGCGRFLGPRATLGPGAIVRGRGLYNEVISDTNNQQRQGDQINRLTLVSLIFFPLTFITGFYGMNFGWMNDVIGSGPAFVALGVALPAVSVVVTVAWLRRRGLI